MQNRSLFNVLLILTLIVLGILSRFLPHLPNAVPLTAIALFAGAKLEKKYAFILPLATIIISDLFIGLHDVILFTWGSYFIIGLIGTLLHKRQTVLTVGLATLSSSLLFFFITNFGVWIVGRWYPLTLSGLIHCFTLAIPFFRNTLLGDVFYTGIFFSSYALILAGQKYFLQHFRRIV